MLKRGIIYIIATPIGNLGDITLRALETLKSVDFIACEDGRVTRKLLSHFQIKKPLVSYHEHNEQRQAEILLAFVKQGRNIALVSDAGTPGISDPGFRIVKQAQREGVQVVSIPGPSALISALSISGLPTDSFVFLGFPSKKPGKRKKLFESVKEYPHSVIFYESPFRVLKSIRDMRETLGNREMFIARELTKKFEETFSGTTDQAIAWLEAKKSIKGEFVIIVGKNDAS